jgi:hypothetical protein
MGFEAVERIFSEGFCSVNVPSVIKKDVDSLPKTFAAIKDAKGGHVARRFR